jgi:hypothetical protein
MQQQEPPLHNEQNNNNDEPKSTYFSYYCSIKQPIFMIKQTKYVQIQMDWHDSINNSIKKHWKIIDHL